MEALILSCSTGGGHNSAARAVKDELLSRGHNAVMLDPYTLDPTWKAAHIGSFYVFTAKYFPYASGSSVSIIPSLSIYCDDGEAVGASCISSPTP